MSFITRPFRYAYRKINPKKNFEVEVISSDGKRTFKGKFKGNELESVIDRLLTNDNEIMIRNLENQKEIVLNWQDRMNMQLDKVI